MRYHRSPRVADIFVSYTSSDRDWAHWIGFELETPPCSARPRMGDPGGWQYHGVDGGAPQERKSCALRDQCGIFVRSIFELERQAAQFVPADERPNFVLPVFIEDCAAPIGMAPIKQFELYRCNEQDAGARLADYLAPPVKPLKQPRFPSARLSLSNLSVAASIAVPNYTMSVVPFDRSAASTTWQSSNTVVGRETS